ncbi:putative SDA1 domain-containing protein [Rosa chinensis]|uniref:Protein SDA1 n=1 Tax=Rosa chinensis TaxID=74649 RepID=A0A2P6R0Z2_ROSCH|nr:protein SDA1 homolog [Rosa chinensis]PRQ40103.1 putative SDA1 domain-containing protein [Rosa chinensis]
MSSHYMTPEPLSASGRSSEKMSLPTLQSKMKCDPEGYETELLLVYNQFKSSLELFKQQADLGFKSVTGSGGSDPTVAKDLADRALFLAHVTPFYPAQLAQFPSQLSEFLHSSARTLPSGLRLHVAQALILLMNRKMVDIADNLGLFMEIQTYGDKALKTLAYNHVIHSIKRMNMKHKNEAKNRVLQNVLFRMLQLEDETKAKRALITLRELHRRKVWFDENTANAICSACFHPSSRIMIACLSFLLDYEKIEEEDDSDASSSDEDTPIKSHLAINREDIYKAHHKGTLASKKKKKAKLQRAIRSLKKQQRITSEKSTSNYHTPLNHLRDPQEFAEKLFSRLQNSTRVERFEVKMMMLKVVARTIGLHRLVLLNFYPYFINYITPHQNGVTELLAAAVQACHDMVPPDAVEPLFKQIVNKFIDDRAQPEAIAVGLNTTREICLRMPLLMTEDLLQDLALYKKSHTKAVSVAARSLIGLFRELNPSLLIKKDRGRQHVDSKARPKAYGEADVLSNVPGLDLLKHDDDNGESDDDDDDEPSVRGTDEMVASSDDEGLQITNTDSGSEDDNMISEDGDEIDENDSDVSGDEDEVEAEDEDEDEEENTEDEEEEFDNNDAKDGGSGVKENIAKKRKFADFDTQLNDAEASLRTLKRLAKENMGPAPSDSTDGFLSNEDFRRIKELKAKQRLAQQGLLKKSSDAKSTAFKIPTSDELSIKRIDPAKLEVHVKRRMTKEEKLALVKAGREDRGKYMARAAVKQKKLGGLSNKQKEHKKAMPLVAKRAKVAKSRVEKRKKQQLSGKNFRGKKAWK